MRTVPALLQSILDGGVFLGENRNSARVTVEPDWWLNLETDDVGSWPTAKRPVRWWQRADNGQVELELPNVTLIDIDESIDNAAGACTIQVLNQKMRSNVTFDELIPTELGQRGYYTPSRGDSLEAQARWGQVPNDWNHVLVPNALLRCVDTETEILTKRGWLRWDQVQVGDQTLGIDPSTSRASWQIIEEVFAKPHVGTMTAMKGRVHDSLTTGNHRWLTRTRAGRWVWKTTDTLTSDSSIPLSAKVELPVEPIYDDDLVELAAWYFTEGSHEHRLRSLDWGMWVSQSHVVNPENVERIRLLSKRLYGAPGDQLPKGVFVAQERIDDVLRLAALGVSGRQIAKDLGENRNSVARWLSGSRRTDRSAKWCERPLSNGKTEFHYSQEVSREIKALVHGHDKIPTPEFLCALTLDQLDLFIEISLLGDGTQYRGQRGFIQKHPGRVGAFEMACALAGRPVHTRLHGDACCSMSTVLHRSWVNPVKASGLVKYRSNAGTGSMSIKSVPYDDVVWCPRVEHGNWLARRNGSIYYTGNTYEGFGGHTKPLAQAIADGNVMLTGVWLVDDVTVTVGGKLEIKCRDMMKLLIEQILFPALMPLSLYPLAYCLPPDELILMADGTYRAIGEIQEGDEVLTGDGSGKVDHVFRRHYDGDLVSIYRAGSNVPVRLTANHEVVANQGRVNPKWDGRHRYKFLHDSDNWQKTPAGELTSEDWVQVVHPTDELPFVIDVVALAPGRFVRQEDRAMLVPTPGRRVKCSLPAQLEPSRALARVMGYFLAEGSFRDRDKHGNRVTVTWTFNITEADLVADLQAALHELGAGTLCEEVNEAGHKRTAVLRNRLLKEVLHRHCNWRSRRKRLSAEMMMAPHWFQEQLLETYLAGDGHLQVAKYDAWNAVTTSEILARQLVVLGSRVYGRIPCRHYVTAEKTGRDCNHVVFNRASIPMRNRRWLSDGVAAAKIMKTETEHYVGEVVTLSVVPQRTFVAGDMVVGNSRWVYSNVALHTHGIDVGTVTNIAPGDRYAVLSDSSVDHWYPEGSPGSSIPAGGYSIHGHKAGDAFDGNDQTYWLGEGNSGADKPFAVNFLEVDCAGEAMNAIFVNPWAGNYTMYISIMENGVWQGGANIVPYDPSILFGTQPYAVNTGAAIPYVTAVAVPWETAQEYVLDRVYAAQKVRITFRHLVDSGIGPWLYRAGVREFRVRIGAGGAQVGTMTHLEPLFLAADTDPTSGYITCDTFGNVDAFGDARTQDAASPPGTDHGTADVYTGVILTKDGGGYYRLDGRGAVSAFGNAVWHGDLISTSVNLDTTAEIAWDIALTHTGNGYWIITDLGHIFAFGDAPSYATVAPLPGKTVTTIEGHPSVMGVLVMDTSGHVTARGSATSYGNMDGTYTEGSARLAMTSTGLGYWVMTGTGRVAAFGDAVNYGGIDGAQATTDPSLGNWHNLFWQLLPAADNRGYVIMQGDGTMYPIGDVGFYGGPASGTAELRSDGDYLDFADIIIDLLMWSGWFLKEDLANNVAPSILGQIEATGTYSNDPMPADLFDKHPVIDAINTIKDIVGYQVGCRYDGGFFFTSPNFWEAGNFDEDGNHITTIPEIDENVDLTQYGIQVTDRPLRSEILISSQKIDPTDSTAQYVRYIPTTAKFLRGMVKPFMWVDAHFLDVAEMSLMAELIALRIWFAIRTGQATSWIKPGVQLNDQVRILERETSESYVHYVRGRHTTNDTESGAYTQQITTNWLGDRENWVITSQQLAADEDLGRFQISYALQQRLLAIRTSAPRLFDGTGGRVLQPTEYNNPDNTDHGNQAGPV